jgi:hypothetical protein
VKPNYRDLLADAREHLTKLQGEIDALPDAQRGTFRHSDLLEAVAAEMTHIRRLLCMLRAAPTLPAALPVSEEVLSLGEVARLCQRDLRTVQRWLRGGRLKAVWRSGTRYVLADSLTALLRSDLSLA